VYFGCLTNMTKALASPERRTLYSANIVEATAPYDLGLIQEGLRAARRLSQLRRSVLLAEVMVPLRAKQRHEIAILQTLLVCSDELESVDLGVLFRIEVGLTVIGFEAKDAGRPSKSVRDMLDPKFCVLTYVEGCLYLPMPEMMCGRKSLLI
jgi:hypothetical protein